MSKAFMRRKKIYINLGLLLFILLLFSLFGYFIFSSKKLRTGPEIFVNVPENGIVVKSNKIQIEGRLANVSRIYLNGRAINIKDGNTIKEVLLLHPGENVFVLEAFDKLNNKSTKKLKVIYKEAYGKKEDSKN